MRLFQPGRDEVDADQHCIGIDAAQVVKQVPGRATEIQDDRVLGKVSDPLEDRGTRPEVKEVSAAALLVEALQLVGPVDSIGLGVTEVGGALILPDQPSVLEARNYIRAGRYCEPAHCAASPVRSNITPSMRRRVPRSGSFASRSW